MTWLLNPGNTSFASLRRSWCCVDKTRALIEINRVLDENLPKRILLSRPRHSGKSAFLGMLAAYYSCGCASDSLFQPTAVAQSEGYRQHLNRYPVIFFDMACQFRDYLSSQSDVRGKSFAEWLERALLADMALTFPHENLSELSVERLLSQFVRFYQPPYILLIDNWDAPFRRSNIGSSYTEYVDFLRRLLHGADGVRPILTCFTGIFPFPDDWQADPDWQTFEQSTMTGPGDKAGWIGYTDNEVHALALSKESDPSEVIRRLGGYFSDTVGLNFPGAVNRYLRFKNSLFSQWIPLQTGQLDRLIKPRRAGFDNMAYRLAAGLEIPLCLSFAFEDPWLFQDTDSVLTSMVHQGYLAYRKATQTVTLPNSDVVHAFRRALKTTHW